MSGLQKVQSGDSLKRFPAEAFNAFVDAAEDFKSRQLQQTPEKVQGSRSSGLVMVYNDSGVDVDAGGVLGIDYPITTPAEDEDHYQYTAPKLVGGEPMDGAHNGKFAIAVAPIPNGEIGPACVSGICCARIDVQDEDHDYADIDDGATAQLSSDETGAAHILWRQAGTGIKWAIVRLGSPGGEAAPESATFPAKIVSHDSGETYTVREQQIAGDGAFSDKPGTSNITARNLAELSLGPGGGVATSTIVLVTPVTDTADPPGTKYLFNYNVYAKYLD